MSSSSPSSDPPPAPSTPLDQLIVPKTYVSKYVDVSALPVDSLKRVAEMSRARRERALADEEVWSQQQQFREESDSFLTQAFLALTEEEDVARLVIVKAESKGFDRIVQLEDERKVTFQSEAERAQKVKELEMRRDKKIKDLHQNLYRESFMNFWKKHKSSENEKKAKEHSHFDEISSLNQTTSILRKAYEYSAPPFATDPEEVWRRGITVAPDLQRAVPVAPQWTTNSPSRSGGGGGGSPKAMMEKQREAALQAEFNLPAYHEFAMNIRKRYQETRRREEGGGGGRRMNVPAGGYGGPSSRQLFADQSPYFSAPVPASGASFSPQAPIPSSPMPPVGYGSGGGGDRMVTPSEQQHHYQHASHSNRRSAARASPIGNYVQHVDFSVPPV